VTAAAPPPAPAPGASSPRSWLARGRRRWVALGLAAAIGVGLLVACLPPRHADFEGVAAERFSFVHGGRTRTYGLFVPTNHDSHRDALLLVVLHGGGGKGSGIEDLTHGHFNTLAARDNAIILYPDAVGGSWRDGRTTGKRAASEEPVDDVGFLSSLVEELVVHHQIDRKRIFVTGASNGGLMAHRLACERSDLFSGIAPVMSAMGAEVAARCAPGKPVAVLAINGTEDPLIPYNGTTVQFRSEYLGDRLTVPATIDRWVSIDGCSGPVHETPLPDSDPRDHTRIRRETHGLCRGGTFVELYTVDGGGHTWPGGAPYLTEGLVGRTSRDMNACEVIWSFFARIER
jgi:polyhydroxybutyrate depolymerase